MAFPVKITGTVYFSTYQYSQVAKIYVAVNGGAEVDTGITVVPIGTTNVGLFEYFATASGTYVFRAESRNASTGVIGGSSTFTKLVPPEPTTDLEALMTARNALGIAQQARADAGGSGTDATARADAVAATSLAKTAVGIAQEARANSIDSTARLNAEAAQNLAKVAVGIAQEARAQTTTSSGGVTVLETQVFS